MGYTGQHCETDVNECSPDPCLNNSTCVDDVGAYTCQCLLGFTGVNCETNIDDCPVNICQNGGECVDQVNGYECQCVNGWSGQHCDEVTSQPLLLNQNIWHCGNDSNCLAAVWCLLTQSLSSRGHLSNGTALSWIFMCMQICWWLRWLRALRERDLPMSFGWAFCRFPLSFSF